MVRRELQLVGAIEVQIVEQNAIEADFDHRADAGRNGPQQMQIAAH